MRAYETQIPMYSPQPMYRAPIPQALLQASMRQNPAAVTHPILQLQRLYGNRVVQRSLASVHQQARQSEVAPAVESMIQRARGGGQALERTVRRKMERALGVDFSHVRIHTGQEADTLNRAVQARAFTTGGDIFFRAGEYTPESWKGRELLAHELTHVVQQNGNLQRRLVIGQPNDMYEQEADQVAQAVMQRDEQPVRQRTGSTRVSRRSAPVVQRRVSFDVLDWNAAKLGPPTLQNSPDGRLIIVSPSGQISISALVQVNGTAGDPCAGYQIGTTQTAWMAWTVVWYHGQNVRDGSITVRHRAVMPMRDPAPGGNIWYDPTGGRNVGSVSMCGDSIGVFHRDSPWHAIPKARNNSVVSGNPLNYLRGYTRGLHLVAYLTARDPGGNFLRLPLRFLYWNSIQDFTFTPNFANPRSMWGHTGQVQVNIGSQGSGVTTDAPYFTTSGPHFNTHFNNSANWDINERQ
jgi:hypothetical protein